MITIATPTFLALEGETQTSTKVDSIVIKYAWDLSSKLVDGEHVPQGLINSQVHANGQLILSASEEDGVYEGVDIPSALHTKYMAILKALNPNVEFTNTL